MSAVQAFWLVVRCGLIPLQYSNMCIKDNAKIACPICNIFAKARGSEHKLRLRALKIATIQPVLTTFNNSFKIIKYY